jgi:GAF domain-containing protein
VVLTRDTSLAVALKALLGERDRLSELDSPKGWKGLNGTPVDAVVLDLPPAPRKAAVEALERKFSGPMVVLLDPDEDPAAVPARESCSVLRRPFGMSELWSLVVSPGTAVGPAPAGDSAPAVGSAPAAPPATPAPAGSDTEILPTIEPHEANGAEPAPAHSEPAWRWRLRRFQQAREPLPADPPVEPVGAVEANSNGSAPEVPSVAPGGDQAPEPPSGEAVWDAVDEAPQAVAARLAERLQAHVVALLLDNGQGLLETAGGVGLAPAERRMQVEYGHDILRELFRVGVGLIDDTDRVAGLLANIPFGHASTVMMVPLIHDGHGFGVLLAGRHRRHPGAPRPEFTELEIEALMDFAEDVAPALRSAVLLRRLKGQLEGQVDLPEGV